MVLPNFLLTQKSKNARMGAGVGKLIRSTNIVYPGKTLVKLWHYKPNFLKTITKYLLYKWPNKLLVKIVTNKKNWLFYTSKL